MTTEKYTFRKITLALAIIFSIFPIKSEAAQVGDRLVIAINGIPYSQVQIESHLNTKEALRADPSNSELVSATNWPLAVKAFIDDTVIYQEAMKGSGNRPRSEVVDKGIQKVEATLQNLNHFRDRFTRLAINQVVIKECVSRILAIENYRKTKSNAQKSGATTEASKWHTDMIHNTILRWFDGGKDYVDLAGPIPK
jgi:hypothetical protein